MTELVTADRDLRQLVEAGKITLPELMTRLAEPLRKDQEDAQSAKAPKPKPIVLSDDTKKLLRSLPAALADVALPTEVRPLTKMERDKLVPLFDQVKDAKKAVTKVEDAIKEVMHGHIDASTSDGPIDKNGHKLTEGEVVADNYDQKVVRGLVGGTALELTIDDLDKMLEDGEITKAQYGRMSEVVPAKRKPAPEAIMAEIRKHGDLIDVFAKYARPTAKSTAVRMAAN